MGSRHNEHWFSCKYVFFLPSSLSISMQDKRDQPVQFRSPLNLAMQLTELNHCRHSCFLNRMPTQKVNIYKYLCIVCGVNLSYLRLCIFVLCLYTASSSVSFHNRPHFKTMSECFSSVCLWLYNCLGEKQRQRHKGAGFSSSSLENVQVLYNYIEKQDGTLFVPVLEAGNVFDSEHQEMISQWLLLTS